MKNEIPDLLARLEEERGFKILFACESGSRAWGFPSKDSDFDVRFIYIYPTEHYLSINDNKDTIELPINDLLDVSGWDIRKALRLYRGSNATLFEWLQSPIVYKVDMDFLDALIGAANNYYSLRAGLHHYTGIAGKILDTELQPDNVKLKKYFYVIRPVLACRWIRMYNSMPPMELSLLMETIRDRNDLKEVIDKLVILKFGGTESGMIQKNDFLNQFLAEELALAKDFASTLTVKNPDMDFPDKFFRELLASYYPEKSKP